MKIAVMGAGAVGCYYGGMLARAGHAVVLIGRSRHVDAVLRDGLHLETQSFQLHLPMQASTDASGIQGAKLVLCCVKSMDTESTAADMAPHLEADAFVLSLQNGVDNAARLQAVLPCEIAPAVVYVAAEMVGPGHVRHHGRGELVIGPSSASAELAPLFSDAGVPVRISENVTGALWAKLIVNCVYNALSAITQMPYGRLVREEGVEELMRTLMQECLAVAECEAVTLPGNMWEEVQRIARTMPAQLSSTAHDLARHKCTEIDHLNGYIARKGEAFGVGTPVNRAMHTMVKLIEGRSTSIGK